MLYADKNILDTLRSTDSVYLEVATFQIDSTSQSIYDLKAQKNLPFRFREVSGYVKWGVFFLLMLLAASYALKRYLASRGKGFGDLFKPAPPLPPHVAAIQALEALHNQKLWQNNRHKPGSYTHLDVYKRQGHVVRRGKGFEQRRGGHVDPFVGALRREDHRHQQLIRVRVVQFAFGHGHMLRKPGDYAVITLFGRHKCCFLRRKRRCV